MPQGERILSPSGTPSPKGREHARYPCICGYLERVSVYPRVHSCVPACILMCTRVYTPPLLPRGRGGSLRGAPLPLREAKRRTIGGGGEREDYHSPRLVVSTVWEGWGRLCLRGRVASPGATYEGSQRAALSPPGEGKLGVWLMEYWHLPNTCYICNERYSWSTMHPTRAPSQPLELE